MKIEAGRADVNAMMVKVARQMSDDMAAARKRMASGDDNAHVWDHKDQIAVIEQPAPPWPTDPLREPRTRWVTLGELPFGLQPITVEGSQTEAARNKWTLRELLTRRLHRTYRNALVAGKVMRKDEAAKRAKLAEVYVASMDLGAV